MLKKRLVGVVTVKAGWAVQSFGYKRYLPLGKPECLVENLERWGADEILVQCIDRSVSPLGPDFNLLDRIGRLGLDTPLIYGGGIRSVSDGDRAIALGADRIVVDSLLFDDVPKIEKLSQKLGAQAVIASMPLTLKDDTAMLWNYRSREDINLPDNVLSVLSSGKVSEVMLIDWKNEGRPASFNQSLVASVRRKIDIPQIVFGGISAADQVKSLLSRAEVSAVAIGNFLNYREHAIQTLKSQLVGGNLRGPSYATENSNVSYV